METWLWVFFVGIDFYNSNDDKKITNNDIQIYYFDSSHKTTSTTLKQIVKDHHDIFKFSAICWLLKLVLLFGRSKQSKLDDMIFSTNDTNSLKIKKDLFDKMTQMEYWIIHVSVTQQNDSDPCGLHVILFFWWDSTNQKYIIGTLEGKLWRTTLGIQAVEIV